MTIFIMFVIHYFVPFHSGVNQYLRMWTCDKSPGGGGGFSHWHGIRICACLLGHFFAKFGIAIGGFSSETKEPKLHKLGVFWANYCKKHPIWSKLGAFLSKMVYWWVGNLAKIWYRDSQIFEVRQAHPRTILVKEPPPPGINHSWSSLKTLS